MSPRSQGGGDAGGGLQVELVLGLTVLVLAATVPALVDGSAVINVLASLVAVATAAGLMVRLRDDNGWSRLGWRQLEQLIPELVGQADASAILRLALADSPGLLRCSRVEVVLEADGGRPGLIARQIDGTDWDVEVSRALDGSPLTIDTGRRDVVVDVGASGRRLGVLVASGGTALGRRTRRHLASALAHVIASAMVAERLFATERRLAVDSYELAWRDELTGLGSRALLTHRASRQLALSAARRRTSALLLMDLDDFKRINDTLGHDCGDRVLAEVGRRIAREVRDGDVAVRLGGDEFAILVGDLTTTDDAAALAERLLSALAEPLRIDDVELSVRGSLGMAVQGEDGDSLDALLQAADVAMYQAKDDGLGRWRRYSSVPAGTTARGPSLAHDLRAGIPDEQLLLQYQPQVDALTGRVLGFEALVWWQHPRHGLLAPEDFVPEAERQGLSRSLTRSVLGRALEDLGRLRTHAPEASVSLNISARHLLSRGLVVDVGHALAGYRRTARDLVLEVGEPAGGPSPTVSAVLDAVRELGCDVSVHRFGTAQSSLTTISQHAAIREVKIDSAIASRVLQDPGTERLVRGMVTAAHGLGVRVVAEGVESGALVAALTDLGCDRLQGAGIHEPAAVEDLLGWLALHDGCTPAIGAATVGRN